ncbi:hypothetical protein LGM63_05660 [Burkholderia cepacia]|uniref:hypothetical protein n=1 Tax=Burkholderia cepacia TaxID=292 RepID=UPI001CF2CD9C|nr:hypothetical protein [Burkholderia cepacia]MCA7990118.1 hypothetical protein [Burkholderia cepacia]
MPAIRDHARAGDEKRSALILRADDWEERLTTSNVEVACAVLQLYPADEMAFEQLSVS